MRCNLARAGLHISLRLAAWCAQQAFKVLCTWALGIMGPAIGAPRQSTRTAQSSAVPIQTPGSCQTGNSSRCISSFISTQHSVWGTSVMQETTALTALNTQVIVWINTAATYTQRCCQVQLQKATFSLYMGLHMHATGRSLWHSTYIYHCSP